MFIWMVLWIKPQIITYDFGGIINFMFTQSNVQDTNPIKIKGFIRKFYCKLFGDKLYFYKDFYPFFKRNSSC